MNKKLLLLLFIITTPLFSKYTENKIPKPEIREFNTLKISDLTQRIQINTAIGGDLWVWNNYNNSELGFNLDKISIGIDKYFLFYNGITSQLKYNFTSSLTVLSFGYKLKLYEVLYTKLQLKTAVYPYFDLGASVSLGIEFSLFNLLRVYTYSDLSTFILNSRNLTTLYFSYQIGIGTYF